MNKTADDAAAGGRNAAVHALLEAEDIQTPHLPGSWAPNPAFPEGAAEKDYGSSEDLQKLVLAIAEAPNPDLLLEAPPNDAHCSESCSAGIPVVLRLWTDNGQPRHIVWHGSARIMGLQLAYRSGTADAYRGRLRAAAPSFGIPAEQIDRMRAPVLVRVFSPQLPQMTRMPQVTTTAAKGEKHDAFSRSSTFLEQDACCQAASLARALSLRSIVQIGRLTTRMTMREALDCKARTFIRLLTADGILSDANRDEWLRGNALSRAGKERLELTFAARAAETPERLRAMSPELRRKIERIVPCLIRVESRGNGLGILRDVQTALDALYDYSLKRAENDRFSLDDYLEQVDFTRIIPPQAKTLARCLALMDRTALGKAADAWAKEADFAPKQLGLFESAEPEPDEPAPFRFWEEALARQMALLTAEKPPADAG